MGSYIYSIKKRPPVVKAKIAGESGTVHIFEANFAYKPIQWGGDDGGQNNRWHNQIVVLSERAWAKLGPANQPELIIMGSKDTNEKGYTDLDTYESWNIYRVNDISFNDDYVADNCFAGTITKVSGDWVFTPETR